MSAAWEWLKSVSGSYAGCHCCLKRIDPAKGERAVMLSTGLRPQIYCPPCARTLANEIIKIVDDIEGDS